LNVECRRPPGVDWWIATRHRRAAGARLASLARRILLIQCPGWPGHRADGEESLRSAPGRTPNSGAPGPSRRRVSAHAGRMVADFDEVPAVPARGGLTDRAHDYWLDRSAGGAAKMAGRDEMAGRTTSSAEEGGSRPRPILVLLASKTRPSLRAKLPNLRDSCNSPPKLVAILVAILAQTCGHSCSN